MVSDRAIAALYDHLDVRVTSLAGSRALYDALLPALGFSDVRADDDSVVYYHESGSPQQPFFGLIVDDSHQANGTRIAFAVSDRRDVDRVASIVENAGARNFEGAALCPEYSEHYYATFFEDNDGNKLEICCRTPRD